MSHVSSTPRLSPLEFEAACNELSDLFGARQERQSDWLLVEPVQCGHGKYWRITKPLSKSSSTENISDSEEDEIKEEEDEVGSNISDISLLETKYSC